MAQASTASAGTQDGEKKNSGNEGERTFSQEEVNSMLAKERRETQAKYPHYDEYKQAYDEAQKKADADKSELQKATDRADAAEAELAKLKSEKERASWIAAISKETGVPEAALHGDTEEDVRACAESLKSYFEDPAAPTVKTGFWSSGILTGSQTGNYVRITNEEFWSSGILTGSQTCSISDICKIRFWSSGILTGSQTRKRRFMLPLTFWSSGILTGSQTTQGGEA